MIQITLQVMEMPENAYANTKLLQAQLVRQPHPQAWSWAYLAHRCLCLQNLAIIPALLHAAILGLLTAAVPLKAIATATTLAVGVEGSDDDIVVDPGMAEADKARSIHVLGFTSDDELLLAESAGSFTAEEWDKILQTGQRICCQDHGSGLDTAMSGDRLESQSIKAFVRSVMETKTSADLYWK